MNQADKHAIHLGCSSWQFDGWKGSFYPDKLPPKQWLAFYVQRFDTIEVNTSYYALPRPSVLVDWVDTAPPGFTFALKAWRAITHEKMLVDAHSEALAWLDTLRALGSAAAPGLLQLPPHLTRAAHGKALADFLDWFAPLLAGVRIAVEVRAADLMTQAFAGFVAERGMTFALVDRVNQPDTWDLWEPLVESGDAPKFTFVRWIGDDRNGPQGDAEIQTPRDEELARWAQRVLWLRAQGHEVFGYMHNPYEGHSPASVRRLYTLLDEEPYGGNTPAAPQPPVAELRNDAEDDGQLTLFS